MAKCWSHVSSHVAEEVTVILNFKLTDMKQDRRFNVVFVLNAGWLLQGSPFHSGTPAELG